jgi:hypothetical protein
MGTTRQKPSANKLWEITALSPSLLPHPSGLNVGDKLNLHSDGTIWVEPKASPGTSYQWGNTIDFTKEVNTVSHNGASSWTITDNNASPGAQLTGTLDDGKIIVTATSWTAEEGSGPGGAPHRR